MTEKQQWIVYGILGGSLAFNALHIFTSDSSDMDANGDNDIEVEAELPEEQVEAVVEQTLDENREIPMETLSDEWTTLHVNVQHSLTRTFKNADVPDADALSLIFTRLFVWDVNLSRDLRGDDKIDLVYRTGDDGFPKIAGARLHSQKYGKTFTAYRWKAPADTYPSYWMIDGTETNYKLNNSPIRKFEQITSLLKDGRGHKGMDWKAPVGTPTYAPKSAKVTRVNFGNFRYNGNCVELEFSDGTLAKYLHLNKVIVKAGQNVRVGDQVGMVGNTGRSTAPHLHYQLNKGKKVLDPVKYHGTFRRKIKEADVIDFLSEIGPIINALDAQVIAER
jgi:murein DD-endopeptidase MepM/ murein hydrolase activator NlpD